MKLWKYGLLIVSVSALILSSGVVSATTVLIDDPENDVYMIDLDKPMTQQMTQNIGDQPNVDIKKFSCVIDGGTLTATLELVSDGVVQHEIDMDYSYNIQLSTSDGGMYIVMVNYAGEGGQAIGPATPSENAGGTLEISGNILRMVWVFNGDATVTVNMADASYGPTDRITYRDVAEEVDEDDDDDDDDTAGDDDDDDTAGDDDDDDEDSDDTPGFEAVAVIGAIGVALILLERRRK